MFRSIFAKQMFSFCIALIFGFSLLGLAFLTVVRGFFVEQKKEDLSRQCRLFESAVQRNYNGIFSSSQLLKKSLETVYEYTGMSFFFAQLVGQDSDGMYNWGTVLMPNVMDSDKVITVLSSENFNDFFSDTSDVSISGNFFGLYSENVLTISHPVTVRGNVVGSLFISTPLDTVNKQTSEFMRTALLCLMAATFVSVGLVYFLSRKMSEPIHKVSEAAKIIAAGNFDKRLVVSSRDEIGELAENFNNMAESLHKTEETRREFIANVSHDLRSPLTSIKGFLTAIMDGTIPEEMREKYLTIIMSETERMQKLANDVLDISKIQNPETKLELSKFDINNLFMETAVLLESRINAKKIEVNFNLCDEKIIVNADREKIKRVIYNLIDNAVKFTAEKGIISLSTSLGTDKAIVSVKDSGIGLSIDDQKRVFDRFYKADASRGEDKIGSGLGLAIVKEFIKSHGGSVSVSSVQGQGCCFTFSLPI